MSKQTFISVIVVIGTFLAMGADKSPTTKLRDQIKELQKQAAQKENIIATLRKKIKSQQSEIDRLHDLCKSYGINSDKERDYNPLNHIKYAGEMRSLAWFEAMFNKYGKKIEKVGDEYKFISDSCVPLSCKVLQCLGESKYLVKYGDTIYHLTDPGSSYVDDDSTGILYVTYAGDYSYQSTIGSKNTVRKIQRYIPNPVDRNEFGDALSKGFALDPTIDRATLKTFEQALKNAAGNQLWQFVSDNKMAWEQFFDGKGWNNKFATFYGVRSVPTMILVDKKGVVRYIDMRGESLISAIKVLLAE